MMVVLKDTDMRERGTAERPVSPSWWVRCIPLSMAGIALLLLMTAVICIIGAFGAVPLATGFFGQLALAAILLAALHIYGAWNWKRYSFASRSRMILNAAN